MKHKIYAVIISTVVVLLIGCSKEPPKCSDESTIKLVRQIILEKIGAEGLTEKEIQETIKIEYPRAAALDKNIKKYSCEAKLVAGGKYELPISYESQLDDKSQHIVSLAGISSGDLQMVALAINESINQGRATKKSPQEQTQRADEEQTSSAEKDGICKGLDLAVTLDINECLNRKYAAADKELNSVYKEKMSSLDGSRKAALKKEQIAWVKEKESKCPKAGKEVEGGSMETVMINDCYVQMTEKRVEYLKNFQ